MSTFSPPLSRGQAALRGALALLLGVVFLVWPSITIGTAVVLFAIYCFVDAFAALGRLVGAGPTTGDRVLMVLRAFVDVIAAIVAIAYPGPTAEVLTLIVGVYIVVAGVVGILGSRMLSRRGNGGAGWPVAGGLLSIVAGLLLVVWPDIGAVTLAIVFGAYLAAYGAMLLLSAAKAPNGARVSDPLTSP